MNQKILTIIFLMVAVVFVAVFAAGDNDAAASGSSSAEQTATLIVQSSDQNGTSNDTQYAHKNTRRDIALTVTPTAITMTTDGYTNPCGGETAYSGTGQGNNNIIVRNKGEVTINILVRSASTQFSDGSSNVFTPTIFTINSQGGSPVTILNTNMVIAAKMPKNGSDSLFSTYITLGIPFYVHSGNYQNPLTYTAIKSELDN